MALWNDKPQENTRPATVGIPKTFHYIWNHSPMPDVYVDHQRALQRLHPDWKIMTWDDESTGLWMELEERGDLKELVDLLAHAYEHSKDKRQVSDILRVGVLYRYGGVYIDCDYTPLKNFEPLLEGEACVLSCETASSIINGFIAAEPEDPFIRYLIDNMPASYFGDGDGKSPAIMAKTGPKFTTRMYHEFLANTGTVGCRLLEKSLLHPYGYTRTDRANEDFPDSYAVHRWASVSKYAGVQPKL